MSNKFQIKRSTISGRTPNTTNSANSSFLDVGELAINLPDKKLFSSNGTVLVELGSNLTSLSVTNLTILGGVTANGSIGTNGQFLSSNGSVVYWQDTPGLAVYDESNTLLTTVSAVLATNINDLADVDTATTPPANNNLLTWSNTTSTWVPSSNLSLKSLGVTYTPATTTGAALTLTAANTQGGTGYADFLKVINSSTGATANSKTFRLSSTGGLEIINNAYTATIAALTDGGNLLTAGTITPGAWTAGQVIKDTMLSNAEVTLVSTTIAATGSDVDFITYNYTPVSSSSYLIVHIHISKYTNGGTTDDSWYSVLKVNGTEIAYSWQMVNDNNIGTSGRSGVLFPLTGRYTNSNTATKTISVAARRDAADDSMTIDNSATSMWLRITEVAR